MIYASFLPIFWLTALLLTFYLLRKKKIVKKKSFQAFLVVMAFLLWIATSLLPVENMFYTFQSPESVIRYTQRRAEIQAVLYGNESYMVLFTRRDRTANEISLLIARRTEDGYKQPDAFTTRMTRGFLPQGGILTTFHVRGTNDYFILGSISSDVSAAFFQDSNGVKIEEVRYTSSPIPLFGYSVSFYMFVESVTDDFYFYFNERRIYVVR